MEVESPKRTHLSAFAILLALFLFGIAFSAASFALLTLPERWSVDLTCLIAVTAFAMGWSLLLRRFWIFPCLIVTTVAVVVFGRNERIFSPGQFRAPRQATGTDWYPTPDVIADGFIWLWATGLWWLTVIALLTIVALLIFFWCYQQAASFSRIRPQLLAWEFGFLLLSAPLIYFIDFHFPVAANEVKQPKLQARWRNEQAERDQRNAGSQKLREALFELDQACQKNDEQAISVAAKVIVNYELKDGNDYSDWLKDVRGAGDTVHKALLDQMITGHVDSRLLLLALEGYGGSEQMHSKVTIARRRHTIALLRDKGIDCDPDLGALVKDARLDTANRADGYFSRVVELLSDAIGDSQHTTPQERVDLAIAIKRAAELDGYDVKPTILPLQKLLVSDDSSLVKEAVAAALEKVKLDLK